jgi:hypothetical protein
LNVANKTLAVISDMHTGSSTALFPINGYRGEGEESNIVMPNKRQEDIYPVFDKFSNEVKEQRIGEGLVVVMLGDAIDGFHHGSMQESLFQPKDQCQAHKILMQDFLDKAGFNSFWGDELYYIRGTESHVADNEQEIAKELGAKPSDSGLYVHNFLELNINGMIHAFYHHGGSRGQGENEGNSLRNSLRDLRVDREKDGLQRLDAVWTGHTHGHTWNTHIRRENGGQFHEMHGIICPSFQAKTIYANGKVPKAVNSVGATYAHIRSDGTMSRPVFIVKPTKDR